MKTFTLGLVAVLSGLVVACECRQRSDPEVVGGLRYGESAQTTFVAKDGRQRLQRPGRLVSSPFQAHCEAVPVRGGRIAQLLDKSLGTDWGEAVWGHRMFGSKSGSGDRERYETDAEYGGQFIFRKDGAVRPLTAADADSILRNLKSDLEGELKDSGVRIVDDKVTKDGMFVTGFSLGYEDPGMPATGSIEGSVALPKGIAGPERLAGLTLRHRETCRLDRVTGDK